MSDLGKSQPVPTPARPKCYRIQGLPKTTTKNELRRLLTGATPSTLDGIHITLAPSRRGLTATIMLQKPLEGLKYPVDDGFTGITVLNGAEDSTVEYVLKRLHSSSWLIAFSIIAVPGLGSHAIGGFKVKEGTTSWIRDFLPEDIPYARILTYGYDSSIDMKDTKYSISDLSKAFLDSFTSFREDTDTLQRPIVFIGHSLGGLLIKEALSISHSTNEARYTDFLSSSYGLLLFGVPNLGIRFGTLKEITAGQISKHLIDDLEVNSLGEPTAYIQEAQHKFFRCCKSQVPPFRIKAYYEQKKTPTVQKMPDGTLKACGEPCFMVTQESACRVAPEDNENDRHPLNADHSKLVKFPNQFDDNYNRVLSHLKSITREAPIAVSQRSSKLSRSYSNIGLPIPEAPQTHSCTQELDHQSYYQIPFRKNKTFTGRREIILTLESLFFIEADYQRVAISGLGGVGKTQVALEFAFWVKENKPDYSVFWISALSRASFEQSFIDISKLLSLPQENNAETQKKAVQDHLSKKLTKWMLILDNADDVTLTLGDMKKPGLIDYLPESDEGLILMTTRTIEVAASLPESHVIQLEEMNLQEAKAFLTSSLRQKQKVQDESGLIDELLRELSCLPLAITQAASYLNRNIHLSIRLYLDLIKGAERNKIQALSREFVDKTRYRESTNAIMSTWLISFEQILNSDPYAADLLSFISCIEHRAIHRSILPRKGTDEEMENAIGTLCSYAFLTQREDEQTLDMHRLVHLATTNWIESQGRRKEMAYKALGHLSSIFSSNIPRSDRSWRRHLPHGLRFAYTENDSIGTDLSGLSTCLGQTLFEQRRFKEAIQCFEQVLAWKTNKGKPQDALLSISHWLALSYLRDWRSREAIEILEYIVQVRQSVLLEDDNIRLTSEQTLASAYHEYGRIQEAITILEHVVRVRQHHSSEDDHDRLTSQYELARAYLSDSRITQAIGILQHIIQVEEKYLADDDDSRLTSQHELARAYYEDGRIQEAILILQHIVQVEEKHLAEDDDGLLTSQHNLARAYLADNRIKQGLEIFQHVIQIRQRHLVESDNRLLTSQHELARAYLADNRIKPAIEILQHVVQVEEKHLAEYDDSRLTSQHMLARAYLAENNTKKAIEIFEHVVQVEQKYLAEEDDSRLTSQYNLARAYFADNRINKAIELLEYVTRVEQKTLSADDINRLRSQELLARAYLNDGRTKKAIEILEETIGLLSKEHKFRTSLQYWLARAYLNNDLTGESRALLEDILSLGPNVLGSNDPSRIASERLLQSILEDQ